MYIVNTTFLVVPAAQEQWLEMIGRDYIPLLRSGGMEDITFTRVISDERAEHFTFALMVGVGSMADYKRLTEEFLLHYAQAAKLLFGQEPLYFTTLLKKL